MPPKVIAKNADRTGGVLPVNAAARATSTKSPAIRLKLEIRRLPPGLTLTEFEENLGEEWKLANGKVDWREYRQGKTRAPGSGKVPEQSRCYLHMLNEALVKEFEKRFLEVVFHDKAGTHKNPDLKHLQPILGFAPNQRTPLQQAKQRTDNRQGTIDQDSEFITFLESETQPIVKPPALDLAGADNENEKKDIKSTPLIDDLRERKANKAKAVQAKAEKAEKDKKAQQAKSRSKEANAVVEKDGGKGAQQQKVDQAAKEAVKVLNKQAAGRQQQQAQQSKAASPAKQKKQVQSPKAPNITPAQSATSPGPPSPAPQRGARQRGNADGIKKMLQKDLGIRPKVTPNTPTSTTTTTPTSSSAATDNPAQQPPAVVASPKTPRETKVATASPANTESKQPPTKAYLKHANPSQGMTEILIQQALSQYGDMTNVTIDPRRGTAIAVFKQNEGLKKALEAKRITVANGAVEVLEFKDRSAGGGQASRGGFKGGRGGRSARGGGQSGASASAGSPAPTNP